MKLNQIDEIFGWISSLRIRKSRLKGSDLIGEEKSTNCISLTNDGINHRQKNSFSPDTPEQLQVHGHVRYEDTGETVEWIPPPGSGTFPLRNNGNQTPTCELFSFLLHLKRWRHSEQSTASCVVPTGSCSTWFCVKVTFNRWLRDIWRTIRQTHSFQIQVDSKV